MSPGGENTIALNSSLAPREPEIPPEEIVRTQVTTGDRVLGGLFATIGVGASSAGTYVLAKDEFRNAEAITFGTGLGLAGTGLVIDGIRRFSGNGYTQSTLRKTAEYTMLSGAALAFLTPFAHTMNHYGKGGEESIHPLWGGLITGFFEYVLFNEYLELKRLENLSVGPSGATVSLQF